ncbi:MAG: hypothetical protein A3H42_01755 [Deltaproteobacteria bacterium RIFCSPLOWO2_02_FULL_46_8]|nr:MAG: hypothetical protein A3H42_01755 [Deltaproteobacteria bacterium RIFCSPLOWO2_02_FULL_46_8]
MIKKVMSFPRLFWIFLVANFLIASPLLAKGKNSLFQEAEDKIQEGNYEGAQSTYEEILDENSNDIKALSGLAQVLYWQGDYDGAIAQYSKILEEDPKNVDALVGTGKAYLAAGKERKAQVFFNRAEKIEPSNEEVAAVSPQIDKKSNIEILGGYILGSFNYAAQMQGEYQKLTISKERSYSFGLNSSYVNKFTQNGFNTELFGQYYLFENTRVDANLSFAPEVAIFPRQSYGAGLAQTFWLLTPEVHYLFEDYRQANIQTVRPALYLAPFEIIKIGGGYQFQSVTFGGTRRNLNGCFAEIYFTPLEWLSLNGYYLRTNNVFEAGRFPTPFVNFKSNIGGGGIDLRFIASYSAHFDARYESRNNGETSQIYTFSGGYSF